MPHQSSYAEKDLLSSTSPHRSIWLFTSTEAAKAARSGVRRLKTNASAMMNDFVAKVARSIARKNSIKSRQLMRFSQQSHLPFATGQKQL